MTLVEVLIAIALLSVVAAMYMQNTLKEYALMRETQKLTANSFSAAQQAEHQMQYIKDYLNGTPTPTPAPGTPTPAPIPVPSIMPMFSLYGADQRDVKYYPVTEDILNTDGVAGAGSIYSAVTDVRPSEFPVPQMSSATTRLMISGVPAPYGVYATTPYATADVDLADVMSPTNMQNSSYLLQIKYQWYISVPAFPMRWDHIDTSDPSAIGISVPVYPKDFTVITDAPGANTSSLTITPSMAGRHVVCVMTPCARSGKMGDSVVSRPLYIYGPPTSALPAAHYDASLIDDPGDIAAGKWRDLSDLSGYGADAAPGAGGLSLFSVTFPKPASRQYAIQALAAAFDGSNWMGAYVPALDTTAGFTMFAVVSVDNTSKCTVVSAAGGAWKFDASPAAFPGIVQNPPAPGNKNWYILGVNSDGQHTIGKNANLLANTAIVTNPSVNANSIEIGRDDSVGGNSMIDIAELLIYNGSMPATGNEWRSITGYLGEKYNLN